MRLSAQPLLDAGVIRARVAALGEAITADFSGEAVLLLAVLKGAIVFAADLMREIHLDAEVDFIGVRSYSGTVSQGRLEWTLRPGTALRDRNVVLVEDILDTGRTSSALIDWLKGQDTATVSLCVLLDKPSRRVLPVTPDYTGFTIEDRFVVGYGLDYNERYRQLPCIYTLEENPE